MHTGVDRKTDGKDPFVFRTHRDMRRLGKHHDSDAHGLGPLADVIALEDA
jgi:hypothetical protein